MRSRASHLPTTLADPRRTLAAFGDSNAASVVDGGIGRAFRNVNIQGNGGAGDSSSLETNKGNTEANKSGLGKNLY